MLHNNKSSLQNIPMLTNCIIQGLLGPKIQTKTVDQLPPLKKLLKALTHTMQICGNFDIMNLL